MKISTQTPDSRRGQDLRDGVPRPVVVHPQVDIDPTIPVPLRGLSAVGRRRAANACLSGIIESSGERKAIEMAEIMITALGLGVEIRVAMHKHDRPATGFLPPNVFETVANTFFAEPSWLGTSH